MSEEEQRKALSLARLNRSTQHLKSALNKKTHRKEKWDYPSLEWIHRARAQIYKAEKKQPLTEITPRPSPGAAALARRLKLKTIRATELPKRRSQTG